MIFPPLPAEISTINALRTTNPAEHGIDTTAQWWCNADFRPKDGGIVRNSAMAYVMPPCEDWIPGDSMITVFDMTDVVVENVAAYAILLARLSVRLVENPDDREADSQLWNLVAPTQRYKVNDWIKKVRETGDWQDAPGLMVNRSPHPV